MGADEKAIREAHAAWMVAVNSGNLALLLTMVTDDVMLLGPGEAPLDKDGFAAKFSGACKEIEFECISEMDEVVVAGDMAYSMCRDRLRVVPRTGGDTVRFAGHRLTVYRKAADGSWLLARDAHNLAPVT